MLLLIDNYDSFTYNLVHFLGELGADCDVVRNDQISVADALTRRGDGVVISPGPCDPDKAGICLDLVRALADTGTPTLGVCLGHQAIGQAFGGEVSGAPKPVHGKTTPVHHDSTGVFADLPDGYLATRYHSLVVQRESVPGCLLVNAWSDDGLVMGMRHRDLPIHGVQFHPESIATAHGHALLRNFLTLTKVDN